MTINTAKTLPPILYLPSSGSSENGPIVDLRQIRDGRTALLAYTALDRLVAACGTSQRWIVVATETLDEINAQWPYDIVLLDIEIPAEHRRSEGG